MRRRDITSLVLVALAALIALPAILGIARSGDGIVRSSADAQGVPVTLLAPEGDATGRPAVVVVHGFAASSVIMEPLGRVLARAGYVVALPDMSGHGANAAPLSTDDTVRDELQGDLDRVIAWLSAQPGVDAERLALVGHSMGAGAVTRYAIDNPAIPRATVAISLPGALEPSARPRDLLLLYGANEPGNFATAALEQLQSLEPGAELGTVYGSVADGTAVAAEIVPGVEHISIVWSTVTATAMLEWIGTAVAGPTSPVSLDPAWLWLVLMLVAGCIAAIPLARVLYGTGGRIRSKATVPAWLAIALTLGATVVASLAARLAGSIAEAAIPIAVGGYLAVWFVVAAATIAIALAIRGRGRARHSAAPETRAILAGLGMTAYAVALLILSARVTWATAQFVGPRWWVWAVLALILLGFFYADAVLVSRAAPWARGLVMAANRLIVVIALLASVFLLGAPGILTLLLPFMVLLFIVLGYLAIVVSTQTASRLSPALVQAVPLAAVVASGFPLL